MFNVTMQATTIIGGHRQHHEADVIGEFASREEAERYIMQECGAREMDTDNAFICNEGCGFHIKYRVQAQ